MFFKNLLLFACLCISCSFLHGQYALNGSAIQTGPDCFQLTAAQNSQAGSVWNTTTIDLNQPFDFQGDIFLGCNNGGADGMTFTFQSMGTSAMGTGGGNLAYAGITPSLSLQFDTWQNNNNGDPWQDHVALTSMGSVDHTAITNLAGPAFMVPSGANTEDCNWHQFRVTWDPITDSMKVWFDCVLRLTLENDIVTTIFAGNPNVFWGFTGSTGGANNLQQVCITNTMNTSYTSESICDGESIQLQAGPGSGHSWTPSTDLTDATIPDPFADPSSSTVYVCNYLDECGIPTSDTVDITVGHLQNVDLGPDQLLCAGDNIVLDVFQQGASYLWQNSSTASSLTVINPGTYHVTVTDSTGACSRADTIVVSALNLSANFTAISPICHQQQSSIVYFNGTAYGSTNYIWDWDGGSAFPGTGPGPHGVNWSAPGTYTVSLTLVHGNCDATYSQNVVVNEVPNAFFNLSSPSCVEDPTLITYTGNAGSGAGYSWNFNGGQIISGNGQGPYLVEWITPGNYTVCLQVEQNGCNSPLNCQTMVVQDKPEANIDPVDNQCFSGNAFNFVYSGDMDATTYNWNFGADAFPPTSGDMNPSTVSYSNPGIKTVSVIVERNGCLSDTAYITFEVVPEPEADFTTNSMAVCQFDCIDFSYSGTPTGTGQTYMWDFGPNAIPLSSTLPNVPCVQFNDGGSQTVSLLVEYKGCIAVSIQTMTIHPGPMVNAGDDVEFCDGEGGAQIDASVSGGTMPYYYTWNCADPPNCGLSDPFTEDPIANPNVNINAPDTMIYYLQVFDMNGCASNVDSVAVHIKAKPLMDAGPDVFICVEGFGEFLQGGPAPNNQAPLPIEYMWMPAAGLNDPTLPNPYARPDTTTIYTLVGTSINGCTSDVNTLDTLSTVTVHVQDFPIADAGPDTAICFGSSVQLQGFASNAGPNYSYSWTPNIAGTIDDPTIPSPTVSPGFTTTFFLVVSSNGCDSQADSITVTVDATPTVSPGSDESICLFDSVQIDGSASGDPFGTQYSYEWSPTNGLNDPFSAKPNASPNTTTTYTVIAYSEHGCGSDAASITVTIEPTPIVLALNNDTIICEGDTIELRAIHDFKTPPGNPVVYEWTPQDGSILSSPYVPDIQIAPTTTTLYTVEVSVSGDCPTTDEVLVTVSPEIIVGLTADTTRICQEDATQLHATGGLGNATFSWVPEAGLDDPSSDEPWASPDETTTYTVIVAEGACVDSASITLDINPRPIVDYFASQIRGCAGLEVSFLENTQFANNFLWDFGDGSPVNNELNPSHVYNEPGTYTVSLTAVGQGGCEATTSKVSIQVDPAAMANFQADPDFGSDLALPNASVLFTDLSEQAVSWRWNFGDGNSSTEVNPSHTYSEPGIYEVSLTVTDANGCSNTVTYGSFTVLSADLMIPNFFSPNGDGVNDIFRISYSGSDSYQLDIFDRWGRSVFSSNAPQDGWDGMDKNGVQAHEGVYYYSVKVHTKSYNGDISLIR